MAHEDIVRQAKEAISEVFEDTSVDTDQTRESLEVLADEIESLLDCFPEESEDDS